MRHMTRVSNMTEYRYGEHTSTDPRWGTGVVAHTDVHFKWEGDDYGCRFTGFLNPKQLLDEEDRFIERKHKARPRPRGV